MRRAGTSHTSSAMWPSSGRLRRSRSWRFVLLSELLMQPSGQGMRLHLPARGR